MAKQDLGLGTSANDGQGDTLRTGGQKIKGNFDEIYARFGSGTDLETATSANTLVGNGTKFASVATSGDFNISSAGKCPGRMWFTSPCAEDPFRNRILSLVKSAKSKMSPVTRGHS